MSHHDPMVCVYQMHDHAWEALEMVKNRSRMDLDTDRMLNLALVRLMEIIGEAAARVQMSSGAVIHRSHGVTSQTYVTS